MANLYIYMVLLGQIQEKIHRLLLGQTQQPNYIYIHGKHYVYPSNYAMNTIWPDPIVFNITKYIVY